MDEITSLRVHESTKLKLGKVGTANDDYEDVILRLIDFWNRYKGVVERK